MDFSSFTTPHGLLGLLAHAATHKRAESRGAVRKFRATAITDGVPLSAEAYRKYAKNHTGTDTMARHVFVARIEQSNLYEFNPHAYLPDICSPTYSGDINETLRRSKCYTRCITARNFDLESGGMIRRGDIIEMVCKVKRNGETNIKYAVASRILERVDREDSAGTVESCAGGLSGIFETQTVSVMNEYAEGAVTPSSSFTSTRKKEEAAVLNATTTPEEKAELAKMSPEDRVARQKELEDALITAYVEERDNFLSANRDERDLLRGFSEDEISDYNRWVKYGAEKLADRRQVAHIWDQRLIPALTPSTWVEIGKPEGFYGSKSFNWTLEDY